MLRILALSVLIALAPLAASADGDVVRDRLIEELTEEGYQEIRISKTLLGRMRFVATKPRFRREIVVNPRTGVILRDYIRVVNSGGNGGSIGGGLVSCHHLSDMIPVWVALNTAVELRSASSGSRTVAVRELIDSEHGRLKLKSDEVVVAGSLFLAGAVRSLVADGALEP